MTMFAVALPWTTAFDQSPLRDTASAYRDRPTEPAIPSTTSQRGGQRTSATDRQRRNPHSV
jgi:hypothetical protein